MPHSRAGFALLASLALVLGSAAGAGAAPKPKPPPEPEPVVGTLVALGDSFSAGTGTFARVNDCYQSDYAYPVLLAARLGADLDFRACEGATTGDVLWNQLASMPIDTTMVTMTVGGNDVGFADVLNTCALPWNTSSCLSAINAGRAKLPTLATDLSGLYSTIRTTAPETAAVAVAGYPHLFNGVNDCSWITSFDTREMGELNKATDELDAVISGQVAEVDGWRYVDPRQAFDGHAVCDSSPYINGYSSPIEESYHPNRSGNVAYADLFAPTGDGGGGKGGGKPKATSRTMSIDEQADYVADLGLDSPESLERAEAAGLDPREIRGLVAQLRSGNERVQLAALKRIEVLDERASAATAR